MIGTSIEEADATATHQPESWDGDEDCQSVEPLALEYCRH
jgi:hypothetical protein